MKCTVKPLITNTSKEFIKCRILNFLINSSDVFVIKGFTVLNFKAKITRKMGAKGLINLVSPSNLKL